MLPIHQPKQTYRQPSGRFGHFSECLIPVKNRVIKEWTIGQLDIRPYQHILELGYGAGDALLETAGRLRAGFLAGIDPSLGSYRLASRKNRALIRAERIQLHLGGLEDLPYPAHYFDTIYGIEAYFLRKDLRQEILRLASLLKYGGKLVLAFQSRRGIPVSDIRHASGQLQQDLIEAGLSPLLPNEQDRYPDSCIAAIGYKA